MNKAKYTTKFDYLWGFVFTVANIYLTLQLAWQLQGMLLDADDIFMKLVFVVGTMLVFCLLGLVLHALMAWLVTEKNRSAGFACQLIFAFVLLGLYLKNALRYEYGSIVLRLSDLDYLPFIMQLLTLFMLFLAF
jgi:hypothetical protein